MFVVNIKTFYICIPPVVTFVTFVRVSDRFIPNTFVASDVFIVNLVYIMYILAASNGHNKSLRRHFEAMPTPGFLFTHVKKCICSNFRVNSIDCRKKASDKDAADELTHVKHFVGVTQCRSKQWRLSIRN